MSPDQIRLVRQSFDKVWPVHRSVAAQFYERLFALAPETRALFRGDLDSQKTKLMGMIASAVGMLDRGDMFRSIVADLGRRHALYGVQPAHYGPVGQALIESLAESLGPAFTPETEAAWLALYGEVREIMLAQAKAA